MSGTDERDDGVWRDERELPLSELVKAVATSPADGQTDDLTGNDAGIAASPDGPGQTGNDDPESDREPDPTSAAARALRNDFTGPTGPN